MQNSGFGFSNKMKSVVRIVVISQKFDLDDGGSKGGFPSVVLDSWDCKTPLNVPFVTAKYVAESLQKCYADTLSYPKQKVGGDINLGFPRGHGREVNRVNVFVSAKHQLFRATNLGTPIFPFRASLT